MEKLKNLGKGKLTYLAGAASFVLAVYHFSLGDVDLAQQFAVSGAAILGLRRAVAAQW